MSAATGDADMHVHADGTVHSHAHHHDESGDADAAAPGHSHAHDDAHAADHAAQHPSHDPDAPCTCAAMTLSNGWCRRCDVGYVAGVRIESDDLFSALDPHGHELDVSTFTCETCRIAYSADGYCETCGIGFIHEQAYFTRLTYGLAQGGAIDPTTLTCPQCRSSVDKPAWCEGCGRGMVGNVAISDRAAFDVAAAEYAVLIAAVDRAPACELCACAMVVHRTCPKCLISYGHP